MQEKAIYKIKYKIIQIENEISKIWFKFVAFNIIHNMTVDKQIKYVATNWNFKIQYHQYLGFTVTVDDFSMFIISMIMVAR